MKANYAVVQTASEGEYAMSLDYESRASEILVSLHLLEQTLTLISGREISRT